MLVSEETVPKVTGENKQLYETVTKLTSQLEETEAKLQTEIAAKNDLENSLDTRVKEIEATWTAVVDEQKESWNTKEKTLEEKVEKQDRLLNELKATYEVNQRLGKTGEDGEPQRHPTSTAELDMLHSDLERTSSRLAEVETRNEQLRLELAQAKSSTSSHNKANLEDDPGYMRMRSENSSLIRRLDAMRFEKDSLKRDLDVKLHSVERNVGALKDERDTLKEKLAKWSDYDEVKQELDVLKSIEFSIGDDDDGTVAKSGDDESNTLERLLLGRNKKLGDELTILRVSHQDLQTRLTELEGDLVLTNEELEKSQKLNEKLESDLENMHAEGANMFPSGASVAGTYVTRAPTRKGKISPTSSIISGLDPRSSYGERESVNPGAAAGILPMVTAQRDRFKQKNSELEHDLSESHRTVQQLRQEVAALQKDNLTLYEKTRYVSTYNRTGASATAYATSPNPSSVNIGSTGTPGMEIDRYRQAYESNISPFAAFRGRESARAYRRMSLPERVVYSITRMVLATRVSRNLFAAYCAALHVIVFLTFYWMESCDVGKHSGGKTTADLGTGAGSEKEGFNI